MRIVVDALQVATEFSGVGRQALAIGAQLQDPPGGFELELRCAADTRPLFEPAFPPGTRIATPIARSRPRARRILHQQLLAPLRDGPETLLVCLGDQAPLWGRARRLVVVNDVRRLTNPGSAGRLEQAFYRALVPRAARRAHVLATISEFSRREIARVLGQEAQVVAHHPPPLVDRPARSEGRRGLLVVGALRPYKGVETVLEALRIAADPPETLFAGEGRAPEAAGIPARFLGWVAEDELERLYASVAATINPSTYEGYGLPVAESLARGLPTIASDIPPHREVGGDAVLYFPSGDAAALADRIREIPERYDSLAAAALARSRELNAARPTWRDVILEATKRPLAP